MVRWARGEEEGKKNVEINRGVALILSRSEYRGVPYSLLSASYLLTFWNWTKLNSLIWLSCAARKMCNGHGKKYNRLRRVRTLIYFIVLKGLSCKSQKSTLLCKLFLLPSNENFKPFKQTSHWYRQKELLMRSNKF